MARHSSTARVRVTSIVVSAAILITALSFAAPAPLVAPASATWTVSTVSRTPADVRAVYQQLRPTYTGGAYAVTPSWTAPYAPGAVQTGFLADGVNTINFARYLAGLPADVTLSATRNEDAQYGAVLLAASNFSHYPDKPADMTDAFYTRGRASTSSSNIGSGYTDAESFQIGCLHDSTAGNIAAVGHRRWLLNPPMKVTGIGFANNRLTTYAFDRTRTETVDYGAVLWPSAGVFPVDGPSNGFFTAATPWSITLNPATYEWDPSGHRVTLKRISDGRTWTFDASDTNTGGEFFAANFSGYGVPNAFIFRPDPASLGAGGYKPGDVFEVTLSGGIYTKNPRTPASVTYRTAFFSLANPGSDPAVPAQPGAGDPAPAPAPPKPQPTADTAPVYRFYNKSNGSHFYTASAAERDTVIAKWSATYQYEGPAYTIKTTNPANSSPLYRLYNRKNGSHFYTASCAERDMIVSKWGDTYTYEGVVYNVAASSAAACTPVYRFYNTRNGSHFFTVSAAERDTVISKLGATYSYEGVCFYIGQ